MVVDNTLKDVMMRMVSLCLFICSSVMAQDKPLTVLVTHFPPFVNMNVPSEGLAWNLLRDFTASKGVDIKAQYLPNARLLTQVATRDWQATIVTIPDDIEGQVKVQYVEKVISYGVLVKHQKPLVLDGLHISAIRSAGFSAIQKQLIQQGAIVSEVNTLEQAYLMYEAGRVDAVLGVTMNGEAMGVTNPEGYIMAIKLADIPFILYLNKKNPLALAAYNKLITP